MEIKSQLVYDGSKFRDFLSKNKISYQEASERLSIDKNTIGKAVRGGNLSITIILKICNEFNFCLTDFFTWSVSGESSSEYCVSDDINIASDSLEEYGQPQDPIKILENIIASKDEEIEKLKMIVRLYDERLKVLQKVTLKRICPEEDK